MRKSKHIARNIVGMESAGVVGDSSEDDLDEPECTECDGEERVGVREKVG